MRTVSRTKAQAIAAAWHGGQASALYSFASSGLIFQFLANSYTRELASCQPATAQQRRELRQLSNFLSYQLCQISI